MAEIMNVRSIGPNLLIAPTADPGDGQLEVVLVTEKQREKLTSYVLNKLKGIEKTFDFDVVKGRSIRIRATNSHVHIDDELLWIDDPAEIKIEVFDGLLKVFEPDKI